MREKTDFRRQAPAYCVAGCMLAMAGPGWADKDGGDSGSTSRGSVPTVPTVQAPVVPGDDLKQGQVDETGDDSGETAGSGSGQGTSRGRKQRRPARNSDTGPLPGGDLGETGAPPPGAEEPIETLPIPNKVDGQKISSRVGKIMQPKDWRAPAPSDDLAPDAGAPPGEAAGRLGFPCKVPAQGPAGLMDPSNPASAEEFAMASVTGYRQAFDALGLKVSRGPGGKALVTRPDGTPASEVELGQLAQRIKQEPAALVPRPDFFKVLPRESFTELKEDFHDLEGSGEEFRHISLSPGDRDFLRSQSCSRASGSCNRFARRSYKRGEFVPPEDLWDIAEALGSDRTANRGRGRLRAGGFGEDDDGKRLDPASAIPRSRLGGVSGRLASLFKSIGGFFGAGGADEDGVPAGRAAGRRIGAGVVQVGDFDSGGGGGMVSPHGATNPGAAGKVRRRSSRAIPPLGNSARRAGGGHWWPLAAAVMAGILFVLWRRDRPDAKGDGS